MSARSRCDGCGRRIKPARYELGLCAACEQLLEFARAWVAVGVIVRMLRDPELLERLPQAIAESIRVAAG